MGTENRPNAAGFEAAFCRSGSVASAPSSDGAATSTHDVVVMTVVTPLSSVSVRVATTALDDDGSSSVVVVSDSSSSEVVVVVGSGVVVDSSVKCNC